MQTWLLSLNEVVYEDCTYAANLFFLTSAASFTLTNEGCPHNKQYMYFFYLCPVSLYLTCDIFLIPTLKMLISFSYNVHHYTLRTLTHIWLFFFHFWGMQCSSTGWNYSVLSLCRSWLTLLEPPAELVITDLDWENRNNHSHTAKEGQVGGWHWFRLYLRKDAACPLNQVYLLWRSRTHKPRQIWHLFLYFIIRFQHTFQTGVCLSVCVSTSGSSVPGHGEWLMLTVLGIK